MAIESNATLIQRYRAALLQIARLETESEFEARGAVMDGDDAVDTVTSVVHLARAALKPPKTEVK